AATLPPPPTRRERRRRPDLGFSFFFEFFSVFCFSVRWHKQPQISRFSQAICSRQAKSLHAKNRFTA
ncbi:hypothetical protein EE612_055851, partial [Oryza sativa]